MSAVEIRNALQDLQRRPAERRRGARRHRPHDRAGRVRVADRAVGMREVDPAPADREPPGADDGRHLREREAGAAGATGPGLRHGVPAGGPVRMADRDEERRAAAGAEGMGQGAAAHACVGDAGSGQALGLRRPSAVAAVRRDAATGRDRPRVGRPSVAPADGRAVRRAGRDDARTHAGRAAADLRRDGDHRRVRHPLDPRGGLPLDPRRGDVAAARQDQGRDRRGPGRRAERRYPRGPGVLPEGHRGARGAPRHADRRSRRRWSPEP